MALRLNFGMFVLWHTYLILETQEPLEVTYDFQNTFLQIMELNLYLEAFFTSTWR